MNKLPEKIIDWAANFVASDKSAFPTFNFLSGVVFWGAIYFSIRYGLLA